MSREIFLYGHFLYGHRFCRYICPDDLVLYVHTKTGAIWLLFAFQRDAELTCAFTL